MCQLGQPYELTQEDNKNINRDYKMLGYWLSWSANQVGNWAITEASLSLLGAPP